MAGHIHVPPCDSPPRAHLLEYGSVDIGSIHFSLIESLKTEVEDTKPDIHHLGSIEYSLKTHESSAFIQESKLVKREEQAQAVRGISLQERHSDPSVPMHFAGHTGPLICGPPVHNYSAPVPLTLPWRAPTDPRPPVAVTSGQHHRAPGRLTLPWGGPTVPRPPVDVTRCEYPHVPRLNMVPYGKSPSLMLPVALPIGGRPSAPWPVVLPNTVPPGTPWPVALPSRAPLCAAWPTALPSKERPCAPWPVALPSGGPPTGPLPVVVAPNGQPSNGEPAEMDEVPESTDNEITTNVMQLNWPGNVCCETGMEANSTRPAMGAKGVTGAKEGTRGQREQTAALGKTANQIGEQYLCSICNKVLSSKKGLKRHMLTHSDDRPFSCDICCKRFKAIGRVTEHRRRQHPEEKPLYSCTKCGKAFEFAKELRTHSSSHFTKKSHMCSDCGKEYTSSSALKNHKLVHTGQKPYKCSTCLKAFREKTHLTKHERIHSGQKPFKCTVCSKTFSTAGALHIHERSHTGERPYSCDVCGDKFKTPGHLSAHHLKHTGERPLSCPECGQKFRLIGHLISHKLTHTGDKPYKCTICNKEFAEKARLIYHMHTHNKYE